MKNKTLFSIALSCVMILFIIISGMKCSVIKHVNVLQNLEALAQEDEGAKIVCSASICGRCFEEKKAFPFYKCNWTGMQIDFCDCDKIGWL